MFLYIWRCWSSFRNSLSLSGVSLLRCMRFPPSPLGFASMACFLFLNLYFFPAPPTPPHTLSNQRILKLSTCHLSRVSRKSSTPPVLSPPANLRIGVNRGFRLAPLYSLCLLSSPLIFALRPQRGEYLLCLRVG